MKLSQKATKISTYFNCIVMMAVLLWLTISLPFVYSAKLTSETNPLANQHSSRDGGKAKTDNPFANTTEEKTSNCNSLTEDYLHDIEPLDHYLTELSTEFKVEHFSTYIAFYGELISPPPECL